MDIVFVKNVYIKWSMFQRNHHLFVYEEFIIFLSEFSYLHVINVVSLRQFRRGFFYSYCASLSLISKQMKKIRPTHD